MLVSGDREIDLVCLCCYRAHIQERFVIIVQSLSCVQLFATPWTAAHPGFPVHHQLLELPKLMSIESVMQSNRLILCHPLLLPSVFPGIRVFSNESVLRIRWPKYWSFSFSISPSNEYLGLISSRIDWLDLLAVQGTLKSLLQHHRSEERRVGKECDTLCRSRWSPYH